jgi:hypothetical protein
MIARALIRSPVLAVSIAGAAAGRRPLPEHQIHQQDEESKRSVKTETARRP